MTIEATGTPPDYVIARNVSFEEYMERYAEHFAEWENGTVFKWPPVTIAHNDLSIFFLCLLHVYLDKTDEGTMRAAPFVVCLDSQSLVLEPAMHVVVKERAGLTQEYMTAGPPDVVVEIATKENTARLRGAKFLHYETHGIREYWLIDSFRQEADFYYHTQGGFYRRIELDNGVFESRVLRRFRLDTSLLWQEKRLTGKEIVALVDAMLKAD